MAQMFTCQSERLGDDSSEKTFFSAFWLAEVLCINLYGIKQEYRKTNLNEVYVVLMCDFYTNLNDFPSIQSLSI